MINTIIDICVWVVVCVFEIYLMADMMNPRVILRIKFVYISHGALIYHRYIYTSECILKSSNTKKNNEYICFSNLRNNSRSNTTGT